MGEAIRQVEYVTVTVTLCARTDKGALLTNGDLDVPQWVPRRSLHFTSDRAVSEATIGDELELRIAERTAQEKGLI